MAFCSQCGTTLENNEKFCPNCGAKISDDGYASAREEQTQYNGTAATDNSKTYAILAVVFPFLFFLPLVTQPKTPFGVFWANQALLLFLGHLICGCITVFLSWVAEIIIFIFWIMCIVAVCHNEMKPIPWIGGIEIIK